jgi:hypothetical protein
MRMALYVRLRHSVAAGSTPCLRFRQCVDHAQHDYRCLRIAWVRVPDAVGWRRCQLWVKADSLFRLRLDP